VCGLQSFQRGENLKYALFTLCIWLVWSTFGGLSIYHDWLAFRLLLNLNYWKGRGENCLLHKVGSCEFLMMFFGLTNAPTMLCTLVNDFVVIYIDDILSMWTTSRKSFKNQGDMNCMSSLRSVSLGCWSEFPWGYDHSTRTSNGFPWVGFILF